MTKSPLTHAYIDAIIMGRGPSLILLPGNWLSYHSYLPIIKKLAKSYTVYMPNLFRGKSKPTAAANYIQDYVRALHEFLEAQELTKCFLVGTSFGGFIASEFLLRHPTMVKKALLVNTLPPRSGLQLSIRNAILAYFLVFWRNGKSLSGIRSTLRALQDTVLNCLIKHPMQFIYDGFIAVSTPSATILPENIPLKMLLGSQDEFVPLQRISNTVLASTDHEIIPGDHAWFFTDEDLFVQKIQQFCQ